MFKQYADCKFVKDVYYLLAYYLQIDSTRSITNTKCKCVYNKSGRCQHIVALLYYVNYKESLSKV